MAIQSDQVESGIERRVEWEVPEDYEQSTQPAGSVEQYATLEDDEDRARQVKAGPPRKHISPITGKVYLYHPLTGAERDACLKQAQRRDGTVDWTEVQFYAVNKATVHPTKITKRWWAVLGLNEAGVRQHLAEEIFEASGMGTNPEDAAKNGSTPGEES